MVVLLCAVVYAAALVFLAACAVRVVKFARAPIHLRWELYPVPHEQPDRVAHGGSYFEEVDWWTKPAHFSFWGEMKFMVPEMLFLKGLHEFNRRLWYRSFPFHFGLYLLIGTLLLTATGVAAGFFAPALLAGSGGGLLRSAIAALGLAGCALAVFGAAALLARRLKDEKLKGYTTGGDLFNLVFFIVALGVLCAGLLTRPPATPDVIGLAAGLLTFEASLQIPWLLAAGIILVSLLLAYIPLTHMSHFIAKYFTYHSVRWDDSINRRGSRIEARLAEYLTYRPTWAARHIGADGNKTWAQIAMTNPAQEAKK